MSRRVIGLDLGAYSVKLVRLQCGKQTPKFEVLNVDEEILPNEEGDDRDLLDKQKEALAKLSKLGLLEAEAFAIGLPAPDGQMRSMQVPFLDNRKLEAVLPGILEAEMPFAVNEMIVSWYREPLPKNVAPEDKPEFANIKVAFGKKSAIAQTLQTLQSFAVNPRLMHLSSAVPFELVRELPYGSLFKEAAELDGNSAMAFVDFGHRATNLCIFDQDGLKYARSFLRGGKKLSEEISSALGVSFKEAERLKHEKVNLSLAHQEDEARVINQLAENHHRELCDDILRTFISLKTNGFHEVKSVVFIGGGALTSGIDEFFAPRLKEFAISLVGLEPLQAGGALTPKTALSFAYALSCIQIHAKEHRFNFRKDEFTWRGDLDFLRTKSTPLILWCLVLICSLTIMWSASSLVLGKESKHVESQLKAVCSEILGQKNVAPKKCLAQMKEQIASNVSVGIPEFTASDVYVKTAEYLPKDLNVTISEMDVSDKKLRIIGRTPSFEDVDKVFASLTKIPCFVNVEKGRAQQLDGAVEFHLSSEVDCDAGRLKNKAKP
ncbi:MAG TPA: pilus assembly protein PilM [Myxococcota bacterium]|nr:pilus assembly protein PilM [Myxococcota bacterium]